MSELVSRLGFPEGSAVLIVTCDDLGITYASNCAAYKAVREGVASCAGLSVPGPWAREAASSYRGEDVGVHLTLNAQYDLLRWGPITHSPSLLDGDGGFPRTVEDLWDHADLDELRRECRAQIERAIYWGFDVTHLSCHMGGLEVRPEFFDVALELAVEFELPLRLPDESSERSWGFPFRKLAAQEKVLSPDRLLRLPRHRSARPALDSLLADPPAGVTEVVLRPAIDSQELRSVAPDWPARVTDLDLALDGGSISALVKRTGAHLIGYRRLRALQRST